ncbi:NADPH:quinone reductase [Arthrobacter sp. Soil736]|uniref:NADPH:quinone reductase n=1 Tax=Arthrobacter sp. Soil736 TaxID=1736395 RepID=UPI000AB62350|nr:NADPH:quinone reductase [Arthrobacter sp. Soil736]
MKRIEITEHGSGVVAATGPGVTHVQAGDRVWVSTIPARTLGTYAQTMVCDAGIVHLLPDRLSFEEGAALGVPYTTAYRALFQRGRGTPGEVVLVHGASGGVGIPAVQLAVAHGMTVIGTAGTPTGLELVLQNGAAHALDHTQPGHVAQIRDLTEGRGVDLVVEMLANKNLQEDMDLLASRGRIVIVGSRGPVQVSPRSLMVAEADIRGTALWNMTPADFEDAYSALDSVLRSSAIRPVIGKRFPLADAAEAHRFITTSRAAGKVVLQVR